MEEDFGLDGELVPYEEGQDAQEQALFGDEPADGEALFGDLEDEDAGAGDANGAAAAGVLADEPAGDGLEDSDWDEDRPAAAGAAAGAAALQDEDEDEQQQQQQGRRGDEGGGGGGGMREKLAALAKKQKRAAAAQADGGGAAGDGEAPRKKKHKKDKARRGSGAGEERPPRARRPPRAGEPGGSDDGAGAEDLEQQLAAAVPDEDEELVETAADRAFIDDDGVPEDQRYNAADDDDHLALLDEAEEAEEAAPGEEEDEDGRGGGEPLSIVDQVLARRKRAKKRDAEAEVDSEVMMLVTRMNVCAEKDNASMERRPPQPAIEKLKALADVTRTLRQRKYHEAFLASRGLAALAAWLRPYANGALPNSRVRGELVDLLALLQIDTTNEYVREKLEEAELGKIVMFYYKNPQETMELRAKCRDLVQAWAAPIFADPAAEERKRRARERAHRHRQMHEREERERRARLEAQERERRRSAKVGEEGFRTRAAVPQPSRLDFVVNPRRQQAALDTDGGAGAGAVLPPPRAPLAAPGKAGKDANAIGGRLGKVLQQRKRGARDRMGGVSVEGRGIQL